MPEATENEYKRGPPRFKGQSKCGLSERQPVGCVPAPHRGGVAFANCGFSEFGESQPSHAAPHRPLRVCTRAREKSLKNFRRRRLSPDGGGVRSASTAGRLSLTEYSPRGRPTMPCPAPPIRRSVVRFRGGAAPPPPLPSAIHSNGVDSPPSAGYVDGAAIMRPAGQAIAA